MTTNVDMTGDTITADSFIDKAGSSAATFKQEGILSMDATGGSTGADTTEDVLSTYSMPANVLSAGTKGLRITAWGKTGATANNKTIKLYFGSEVITTPTAATNAKGWWLSLEAYRTGASTQKVFGIGQVDTTAVTVLNTTGAETETGAITIKCTGTNGTAAAGDVVCSSMIVEVLE